MPVSASNTWLIQAGCAFRLAALCGWRRVVRAVRVPGRSAVMGGSTSRSVFARVIVYICIPYIRRYVDGHIGTGRGAGWEGCLTAWYTAPLLCASACRRAVRGCGARSVEVQRWTRRLPPICQRWYGIPAAARGAALSYLTTRSRTAGCGTCVAYQARCKAPRPPAVGTRGLERARWARALALGRTGGRQEASAQDHDVRGRAAAGAALCVRLIAVACPVGLGRGAARAGEGAPPSSEVGEYAQGCKGGAASVHEAGEAGWATVGTPGTRRASGGRRMCVLTVVGRGRRQHRQLAAHRRAGCHRPRSTVHGPRHAMPCHPRRRTEAALARAGRSLSAYH